MAGVERYGAPVYPFGRLPMSAVNGFGLGLKPTVQTPQVISISYPVLGPAHHHPAMLSIAYSSPQVKHQGLKHQGLALPF